jgi:hypothetical protein
MTQAKSTVLERESSRLTWAVGPVHGRGYPRRAQWQSSPCADGCSGGVGNRLRPTERHDGGVSVPAVASAMPDLPCSKKRHASHHVVVVFGYKVRHEPALSFRARSSPPTWPAVIGADHSVDQRSRAMIAAISSM